MDELAEYLLRRFKTPAELTTYLNAAVWPLYGTGKQPNTPAEWLNFHKQKEQLRTTAVAARAAVRAARESAQAAAKEQARATRAAQRVADKIAVEQARTAELAKRRAMRDEANAQAETRRRIAKSPISTGFTDLDGTPLTDSEVRKRADGGHPMRCLHDGMYRKAGDVVLWEDWGKIKRGAGAWKPAKQEEDGRWKIIGERTY